MVRILSRGCSQESPPYFVHESSLGRKALGLGTNPQRSNHLGDQRAGMAGSAGGRIMSHSLHASRSRLHDAADVAIVHLNVLGNANEAAASRLANLAVTC